MPTPQKVMANSDLVQSVAKALDLLNFAAERPEGFRVSEAARHFGMKTPAVHNLLRTMISRGYLVKNAAAAYRIGPAAIQLSHSGRRENTLERAEKLLIAIDQEFPGCTLTVFELTRRGLICRRRLSPDFPGQIQIPYHREIPVYHSVTGCAAIIFSSVPAEVLESRWPFAEYAFPDWESRGEFEAFAAECRRKGYVEGQRTGICLAAFPFENEHFIGVSSDRIPPETAAADINRIREICRSFL